MNRKKRSQIWMIPRQEFQKIVSQSRSIADITRRLGLAVAGVHHRIILNRIKEDEIDASHIPLGLGSTKGRKIVRTRRPIQELAVADSSYNKGSLKRRLLKDGLLRNECYECGQQPIWHNKKLVMVIDHINGVRNDHRLENLRMLCPNCNSQQSTFCGGNSKRRPQQLCAQCQQPISRQSTRCMVCWRSSRTMPTKIDWPSNKTLIEMVNQSSYCQVGRQLGVSDNAIRKRLKMTREGIEP